MAAEQEQPHCVDMDLPSHLQYGSLGTALQWELWGEGPIALSVGFVDVPAAHPDFAPMCALVKRVAPTWSDYANVQFNFCDEIGRDPRTADIRITFLQEGNWSYIGKQAANVPSPFPTMTLGSLAPPQPERVCRRIVLHEFGHALGLAHEHQNPRIKWVDEQGGEHSGIPWDKPAVYAYYQQAYSWPPAKVDSNVFQRYAADLLRATEFDPQSIMIYAIEGRLTGGRFVVDWNDDLSVQDKAFIAQLYPKRPVPAGEQAAP